MKVIVYTNQLGEYKITDCGPLLLDLHSVGLSLAQEFCISNKCFKSLMRQEVQGSHYEKPFGKKTIYCINIKTNPGLWWCIICNLLKYLRRRHQRNFALDPSGIGMLCMKNLQTFLHFTGGGGNFFSQELFGSSIRD